MSPAEKAARHAKLYKVVTTHTSHSWASILVKQLLGQLGRQGMARRTPYIPKDQLEGLYASANKRLFLFDYDVSIADYHLGLLFLTLLSALFSISPLCITLYCSTLGMAIGDFVTDCEDAVNGSALAGDVRGAGETFD